jgi:protein TonB
VTLVSATQAASPASASTPSPTVEQPAAPDRSPDTAVVSAPIQAPPAPDATGDQDVQDRVAQIRGAQGLQTVSNASSQGSNYRARLLAHIQPFRRYPIGGEMIAARGVTQLIFRVDQAGNVTGVWVKSSSGFEALDNEAMATVLRAQPMPRVPAGLPSPLTVQLPVSFNPS